MEGLSRREIIRRADRQAIEFQARIDNQRNTITRLMDYLKETDQLEKFIEWDDNRK